MISFLILIERQIELLSIDAAIKKPPFGGLFLFTYDLTFQHFKTALIAQLKFTFS